MSLSSAELSDTKHFLFLIDFNIQFKATKFFSAADLAVDDISFPGCALAAKRPCTSGEYQCTRGSCVKPNQVRTGFDQVCFTRSLTLFRALENIHQTYRNEIEGYCLNTRKSASKFVSAPSFSKIGPSGSESSIRYLYCTLKPFTPKSDQL